MFENIDLTKTMYFNIENNVISLTYPEAIQSLTQMIERSDDQPLLSPEEIILNSLKTAVIDLNANKSLHPKDHKNLFSFYKWVKSIHNETLVKSKDSTSSYPNNIIYDLLKNLREKTPLLPLEILLRFFLEGANARKMSGNNPPSLYFMTTTLVLDVINVLINLGEELSSSSNHFFNLYGSLKNFIDIQRKVESIATKLKEDNFYKFLTSKGVFEFRKQKNEITGANLYFTEEAILLGTQSIEEFNGDIDTAISDMINYIKEEIYNKILLAFLEAEKNSTKEATILAMWDASEWIAKIYTALKIANIKYPEKYESFFQKFTNHPWISEILSRNETGNYPANVRNEQIANIEFIELFICQKMKESIQLSTNTNSIWNSKNQEPDLLNTNMTLLSNT